ncbi:hypothetical protein [Pelomicrobium sp.]
MTPSSPITKGWAMQALRRRRAVRGAGAPPYPDANGVSRIAPT